ncbi:protein-glutamine gamma-glutamyltransferase 2-like [Protopterus annectens]|uniref:protein-glutamine gamma-glutamyltransferase 2-like n=1 Tax=Protopterus annectens TaxID=7888 RepID=UPI001CFC158E|nr:protein-glutamine gamma-glutamyltransferase 2-like [Protopterus annectens]
MKVKRKRKCSDIVMMHSFFKHREYCIFDTVDLLCRSNNGAHHTDEISTKRLLLRRGQPFHISVKCRQNILTKPVLPFHFINVLMSIGKNNGTQIKLSTMKTETTEWRFSMELAGDELLLTICSPASAIIGRYNLYLMLYDSQNQLQQQKSAGQFYLLFNPWCREDTVYMSEEEKLQEYIMNEHGVLYQGMWNDIYEVPWNFGQFEENIVDICFEILNNSLPALSNPVNDTLKRSEAEYISRIVTAMVNSNDDKGVLLGKWDGKYWDGIPPTRWTGSVQILQQWSRSGAEKVRYGQCWVFAAVACTVLRCLGIPTRCVTNYCSAHDTDGNLNVDCYLNNELQLIPGSTKDIIWNFHCWVESWMARHDLPPGNDGWQILDPTPQERSDGVYCCGPCPVKAVKQGNVDVKYDTAFVFAEVNADIVYWVLNKDGTRSQTGAFCKEVGKCLITKNAYGDKREDITQHYKYPEGSKEEREVYAKAGMKRRLLCSESKDVCLTFKHATVVYGTDFDVYVEICNNSFVDKNVNLTIVAKTVTYNGIILQECHRKTTSFPLKALKVKREVCRIKYEHYADRISEHNLIRITALLSQNGKDEMILSEKDIVLAVPQLNIKIIGEPVLFQRCMACVSFVNPLPITLLNGIFTIEGAGLTNIQEIKSKPEEIRPGQEVTVTVPFIPTKAGLRMLLVDFDTNRLKAVKGHVSVLVSEE